MYRLKNIIVIILLIISCVTSYTEPKGKFNRKNMLKKRPIYKLTNEDIILPHKGKPPTICPKGWGRRAGYGYECVRED